MTMLEKVSAALKAKNCEGLSPTGYYDNLARAAIEAMREPTNAMTDRGDAVRGNHDSTWLKGNNTASIYESMIDAVLNEKA